MYFCHIHKQHINTNTHVTLKAVAGKVNKVSSDRQVRVVAVIMY